MFGEDFMEFGGIIWPEIRLIADIFAVTSSESSYPWIAFREETDVVEVLICLRVPMYVRKSSGSGINDLVFDFAFLSISFFNNRAICLPDKCFASATLFDIMA